MIKSYNMNAICFLFMGILSPAATAFSAIATKTSPTQSILQSKNPIYDYLKFDMSPTFDVLEKTKVYVENQGNNPDDIYDENYVLRGPVIGPINRLDLKNSQKGLDIVSAFPDMKVDSFGFSIDPENPYRCFYMQRWRGTHTVDMNNFGTIYPATMNEMETPVATFSVVWTPEGKITYEYVGAVVDRHEGNTMGKAAVFGMLHTAGLDIPASPGDKTFAFIQRFAHVIGGLGRSWSRKADVPKWWTLKSKGADPVDKI